jgi:hypothetical protein
MVLLVRFFPAFYRDTTRSAALVKQRCETNG